MTGKPKQQAPEPETPIPPGPYFLQYTEGSPFTGSGILPHHRPTAPQQTTAQFSPPPNTVPGSNAPISNPLGIITPSANMRSTADLDAAYVPHESQTSLSQDPQPQTHQTHEHDEHVAPVEPISRPVSPISERETK